MVLAVKLGQISPARIFAQSKPGEAWIGPEQQAALNHLSDETPLRVVLGPASSGKSTILRYFRSQLEDAVLLPISGPKAHGVEVLSSLLGAVPLGPSQLSEAEQRSLLNVFVQERHIQGNRVILCVDNISQLVAPAWAELENLYAAEFADRPLVELAIVGTEADASCSPLNRLLQDSRRTSAIEAVRFLSAPTDQDIASYISWRFARFGLRSTFSDDACRLIHSVAEGRFSAVDTLCQAVLTLQPHDPGNVIGPAIVNQAAVSLAEQKKHHCTSDTRELKCLDENATGPSGPRPGRLVVSLDGKVVQTVDLHGRVIIGRADDCDLQIQSQYLSRHHATILPAPDGSYSISDTNSANGVLVNGKRINRTVLRNGDVVRLCHFLLKVELEQTTAPSKVASPAETAVAPGAGGAG